MKRVIAFLILIFAIATPVLAQDSEFLLHFTREFGYGSGIDVRGRMSASIYGSQENIQSVTFLIDGKLMAEVTAPPFKYAFDTSAYTPGHHMLSAVVKTVDGRTVSTPEVERNFITADQEKDSMQKILLPLLGGVFGLTLIGVLVQVFFLRGGNPTAPGTPRNYGLLGGTICPRCGRPFAIHIWGLNMLVGKLDRCDNCGKWSIVRRVHPDLLAAAERAELSAARAAENAPIAAAETEEERLRKLLDQSRYTDQG